MSFNATVHDPAFTAFTSLLALLDDPEATKAKLTELQTAIAEAAASKAEAETALADLDQQRQQLAEHERTVRSRETEVGLSEHRIAGHLAAIEKWKREQRTSRLVEVAPGLTREPDDTPAAPDPIFDRFADAIAPRARAARVDHRRPRA